MSGPRVYTVDEANALVPQLREAFDRLDGVRGRVRTAKIKLTALEMIWGQAVHQDECPDHREAVALVSELKSLEEEFNGVLGELSELGAQVKDLDQGLVDLFHVREGQLVHLCWKRDEDAFGAWHHVDEGFSARQPL